VTRHLGRLFLGHPLASYGFERKTVSRPEGRVARCWREGSLTPHKQNAAPHFEVEVERAQGTRPGGRKSAHRRSCLFPSDGRRGCWTVSGDDVDEHAAPRKILVTLSPSGLGVAHKSRSSA
jgi:hypothetical protein